MVQEEGTQQGEGETDGTEEGREEGGVRERFTFIGSVTERAGGERGVGTQRPPSRGNVRREAQLGIACTAKRRGRNPKRPDRQGRDSGRVRTTAWPPVTPFSRVSAPICNGFVIWVRRQG